MFGRLKLKNFRRHEDLEVIFENGVIALRGANERGKTTLLEAASYAMGGATMLREPLVDVVTWGHKDSTLKVWLDFTINGVTYSVMRGKSGAEIKVGAEIKATGQSEVTRYIETLLGCPMKVAANLMLADQGKLRGTLTEDGAAIKLIEQLANFAFIDQLIGLVQSKLPCGATTTVESRIATLEQQAAAPVEDDTPPLVTALGVAQYDFTLAETAYSLARDDYDLAQQPAKDAQGRINAAVAASQALQSADARLAAAKAALAQIMPVPGPSSEEIEVLRRQAQDVQRHVRAVVAHRELSAIKAPANEWEGTAQSLREELQKVENTLYQYQQQQSTTSVKIAQLRGQKITETACGLCGKDLSAVPEVVTKNAALDAQIADCEALQAVAAAAQMDALELRDAYREIVNADADAGRVYQKHAEFVILDTAFVPARWTWAGPAIDVAPKNVAAELQQAEAKAAAYQRDLGRQQQATELVEQLTKILQDAAAAEVQANLAVGDAQGALDAAAAATAKLYEVENVFRAKQAACNEAQNALTFAQRILDERKKNRATLEQQLVDARKELADMAFNNELIKDLRAARPAISDELWNMAGAAVSNYFSDIRGVPSVFSRSEDGFLVNGKSIKGLSGSTLDALGLAVRMALTKMFLPNTRFMVLDEPAAAADDDRETNMLGVIASSQFDQVILVTHSDLADSFATQVIHV